MWRRTRSGQTHCSLVNESGGTPVHAYLASMRFTTTSRRAHGPSLLSPPSVGARQAGPWRGGRGKLLDSLSLLSQIPSHQSSVLSELRREGAYEALTHRVRVRVCSTHGVRIITCRPVGRPKRALGRSRDHRGGRGGAPSTAPRTPPRAGHSSPGAGHSLTRAGSRRPAWHSCPASLSPWPTPSGRRP